MVCEKCWIDARKRMLETGEATDLIYHRLLLERSDNPCSPKEQAGEWWDEELEKDTRPMMTVKYSPPKMAQKGYVYILESSMGFCKIGCSKDPRKRMQQFNVSLPFKVTLLHLEW